jgi:lysophospholipid acyltransferase (LPLAT)-like uncharacterized protein
MTRRKKLKMKVVAQFGYLLVLLLGKLTTIKMVGRHYWEQLQKSGVSYILCLWHGRMLLPIYVHRNQGIHTLVSLHHDGEMLAQSLQKLGYRTIRGSSTRGGRKALYEMVSVLKPGKVGAIIPDGPKGPPQILKSGVLRIAQQAQAYILPMTFSSSRKIHFKSWDKFTLMLPFSKSVVMYGRPVASPEKLSKSQFEEIRSSLERDLVHLEKQADDYFRK